MPTLTKARPLIIIGQLLDSRTTAWWSPMPHLHRHCASPRRRDHILILKIAKFGLHFCSIFFVFLFSAVAVPFALAAETAICPTGTLGSSATTTTAVTISSPTVYKGSGCTFNGFINVDASTSMTSTPTTAALTEVVIEGGTVVGGSGASSIGGIGFTALSTAAAAAAKGPLIITLRSMTFSTDAVLLIIGQFPPKSNILVYGNTFEGVSRANTKLPLTNVFQTSGSGQGVILIAPTAVASTMTTTALTLDSQVNMTIASNTIAQFTYDGTTTNYLCTAIGVVAKSLTLSTSSLLAIRDNTLSRAATGASQLAMVRVRAETLSISGGSSLSIDANAVAKSTVTGQAIKAFQLQFTAVSPSSSLTVEGANSVLSVRGNTVTDCVCSKLFYMVDMGMGTTRAASGGSILINSNVALRSNTTASEMYALWLQSAGSDDAMTITGAGSAFSLSDNVVRSGTSTSDVYVAHVGVGRLVVSDQATFSVSGNGADGVKATSYGGVYVARVYWSYDGSLALSGAAVFAMRGNWASGCSTTDDLQIALCIPRSDVLSTLTIGTGAAMRLNDNRAADSTSTDSTQLVTLKFSSTSGNSLTLSGADSVVEAANNSLAATVTVGNSFSGILFDFTVSGSYVNTISTGGSLIIRNNTIGGRADDGSGTPLSSDTLQPVVVSGTAGAVGVSVVGDLSFAGTASSANSAHYSVFGNIVAISLSSSGVTCPPTGIDVAGLKAPSTPTVAAVAAVVRIEDNIMRLLKTASPTPSLTTGSALCAVLVVATVTGIRTFSFRGNAVTSHVTAFFSSKKVEMPASIGAALAFAGNALTHDAAAGTGATVMLWGIATSLTFGALASFQIADNAVHLGREHARSPMLPTRHFIIGGAATAALPFNMGSFWACNNTVYGNGRAGGNNVVLIGSQLFATTAMAMAVTSGLSGRVASSVMCIGTVSATLSSSVGMAQTRTGGAEEPTPAVTRSATRTMPITTTVTGTTSIGVSASATLPLSPSQAPTATGLSRGLSFTKWVTASRSLTLSIEHPRSPTAPRSLTVVDGGGSRSGSVSIRPIPTLSSVVPTGALSESPLLATDSPSASWNGVVTTTLGDSLSSSQLDMMSPPPPASFSAVPTASMSRTGSADDSVEAAMAADTRLYRPTPSTKQVTVAVSVAAISFGGVVVPIAASQQALTSALLRMSACDKNNNNDATGSDVTNANGIQYGDADAGADVGGDAGSGAADDGDSEPLDVFVHPLQFGIGDGPAAAYRGALLGNLIIIPIVWALCAVFAVPHVMCLLGVSLDEDDDGDADGGAVAGGGNLSASNAGANGDMVNDGDGESPKPCEESGLFRCGGPHHRMRVRAARDLSGWPSNLAVPISLFAEGSAMASFYLLTYARGGDGGGSSASTVMHAVDRVIGIAGAAYLLATVVVWVYALERLQYGMHGGGNGGGLLLRIERWWVGKRKNTTTARIGSSHPADRDSAASDDDDSFLLCYKVCDLEGPVAKALEARWEWALLRPKAKAERHHTPTPHTMGVEMEAMSGDGPSPQSQEEPLADPLLPSKPADAVDGSSFSLSSPKHAAIITRSSHDHHIVVEEGTSRSLSPSRSQQPSSWPQSPSLRAPSLAPPSASAEKQLPSPIHDDDSVYTTHANNARLSRSGLLLGGSWWVWGFTVSYVLSIIVGISEGIPSNTDALCYGRWAVASVASIAQFVVAMTNPVVVELIAAGITGLMSTILIILITIMMIVHRDDGESSGDGLLTIDSEILNAVGNANSICGLVLMCVGVVCTVIGYARKKKRIRDHKAKAMAFTVTSIMAREMGGVLGLYAAGDRGHTDDDGGDGGDVHHRLHRRRSNASSSMYDVRSRGTDAIDDSLVPNDSLAVAVAAEEWARRRQQHRRRSSAALTVSFAFSDTDHRHQLLANTTTAAASVTAVVDNPPPPPLTISDSLSSILRNLKGSGGGRRQSDGGGVRVGARAGVDHFSGSGHPLAPPLSPSLPFADEEMSTVDRFGQRRLDSSPPLPPSYSPPNPPFPSAEPTTERPYSPAELSAAHQTLLDEAESTAVRAAEQRRRVATDAFLRSQRGR